MVIVQLNECSRGGARILKEGGGGGGGGGGAEISHRCQLYVYRAVCNIEFIVA